MAEVQAPVVKHEGDETSGEIMKEAAALKQLHRGKDLPQDYLPFSPPATDATSNPEASSLKDSPTGDCFAANAHTWVSPNKSDEVPSSKESSPDVASDKPLDLQEETQTAPTGPEKVEEEFEMKDSSPLVKADLEAKYDAEFAAIVTDELVTKELDLSIVGEGYHHQVENSKLACTEEAVLDASRKDFIKIIHGDRDVMLVLPSEVTCELGTTLELAETLASSLGITDEIVGLKTTALLLDDESSTFKQHGDCLLPFSSLASGQLKQLLKTAEGIEGIPSFNLVTSNFNSYIERYQEVASIKSEEEYPKSDEESSLYSVQEGSLYTEAFLQLMEKSEEFDPFEKNTLLRFGIDNAEQGNILFRASFRVAVYTGDMSYFVQGLKAIANILLDEKSLSTIDEKADVSVADAKQTSMTIFSLTDFVICADDLYESNDLTAQQYITLLDAIFAGKPEVRALQDLYHNPDFLLACDSDEDLCESLCLRDLLHLGRRLEPLQLRSQGDELLKWAIKTGIHNFAASIPTELPQEFVNVIYHMFSSGDEMILGACQKYVDTDDSEHVEAALLREWDIYCRNKTFREENQAKTSTDLVESSSAKASDSDGSNSDFPECLLTAVACLVDQGELSEDAAAAILASYAKGNELLHDVYDHFIDFGGVDDFLSMLKVIASTDAGRTKPLLDQFVTSRSTCENASESENEQDTFVSALKELQVDGLFGAVEMAALRLASVREDPMLSQALKGYRDGDLDTSSFRQALLDIVERVIEETDAGL